MGRCFTPRLFALQQRTMVIKSGRTVRMQTIPCLKSSGPQLWSVPVTLPPGPGHIHPPAGTKPGHTLWPLHTWPLQMSVSGPPCLRAFPLPIGPTQRVSCGLLVTPVVSSGLTWDPNMVVSLPSDDTGLERKRPPNGWGRTRAPPHPPPPAWFLPCLRGWGEHSAGGGSEAWDLLPPALCPGACRMVTPARAH